MNFPRSSLLAVQLLVRSALQQEGKALQQQNVKRAPGLRGWIQPADKDDVSVLNEGEYPPAQQGNYSV